MRSLGFATDLLAMRGESVAERHADRMVQRTPAMPNFWFGNRVLFRAPPESAETVCAQFAADFPDARHICLGWDVPDLDPEPVRALFADTGVVIEQDDVLSLTGPFRDAPAPEGIVFRPLSGADWTASEEIAYRGHLSNGLPPEGLREYLASRSAARRRQIANGLGQWFGAFDGTELVGDMGIFHDDRLIRYQSVQTRESHRRRGICSALLGHALRWAQARAPDALAVIVAEADGPAGRLYRRAGFSRGETLVSAYRPPG